MKEDAFKSFLVLPEQDRRDVSGSVAFSPWLSEERRTNLEAGGWTCRNLDDFRRLLLEDGRGPRGPMAASPKVAGDE